MFSKRRMFRRLLTTCIAIFLIPFLTILLVYTSASGMIRDEIIHSNRNSLYQFYNALNVCLLEGHTTASQIAISPVFRNYAARGKLENPTRGTDVYALHDNLQACRSANFTDVFVYFPANDLIISQMRASLDARIFWQTYYTDTFETFDRFSDFLTTDSGAKITLVRYDHDSAVPYLALVYTQALEYPSSAANRFTVFVLLSPIALQNIIATAGSQTEGIFMLFDANENLLLSSADVDIHVDFEALRAADTYASVQSGAEEYILQMYETKVPGCAYVSTIPNRIFWQRMNHLRSLSLLSVLLCLLLSAVVTLALTRRNYRPIDRLVRTAAAHSGIAYDQRADGELEFLGRVLNTSMVRNDLLTVRLGQVHNTLMESFLLRAMQGTATNEENQEDAFSHHGIGLLSDAFCVALFQLEDPERCEKDATDPQDAAPRNDRGEFIREELLRQCAAHHQGMVVPLDPVQYALILNYSKKRAPSLYASDTEAVCQAFNQELYIHLGLRCTIAISGVHHGLTGIHTAYQEAVAALKYRFLKGKGSIKPYQA
ncbi:MAG TPA: hypothetical protein PKE04_13440, partial [Clostridia bacterium]|nr:hypothetical protein [Clostridia bacterium]